MPEEQSNQGSKYNPADLDEAKRIIEALEKRVNERDDTIKTLRGDLDGYGQRLQAIEDDRKKKLEEEGNWKELAQKRASEVEALKLSAERAAALEGVIRAANEAAIARIPEGRRGLIPVDYAPEKLQTWLAANSAALINQPPPDFNAGEGGEGKTVTKLSEAERQAASLFGVDVKDIEAIKEQDAKK